MRFQEAFAQHSLFLMEGALGERLKREYGCAFDENVAMARLVRNEAGRAALRELWSEYRAIADAHGLPFLAATPTRHANRERMARTALDEEAAHAYHAWPGGSLCGGRCGFPACGHYARHPGGHVCERKRALMKIELRDRTEAHVRMYFAKTRDEEIQRLCPQRAQTAEEAVSDFRKSIEPGANSFGRTIYANGEYVGDVWCYCIGEADGPDAMLSYCLFDKKRWGQGIASEAARLFLKEIGERFHLRAVGAFAYMENRGSVRVLEKNGFALMEAFWEDGRESGYYERKMEE